jgi:hypothetical protein
VNLNNGTSELHDALASRKEYIEVGAPERLQDHAMDEPHRLALQKRQTISLQTVVKGGFRDTSWTGCLKDGIERESYFSVSRVRASLLSKWPQKGVRAGPDQIKTAGQVVERMRIRKTREEKRELF